MGGVHQPDSFQKIQCTLAIDQRRSSRSVKTRSHKALCRQVVQLVRTEFLQKCNGRAGVGQIKINQQQMGMAHHAQFVKAPGIHTAGASMGAYDLVTLVQQKRCQIGAILPGDTRNDGRLATCSDDGLFSVTQPCHTRPRIGAKTGGCRVLESTRLARAHAQGFLVLVDPVLLALLHLFHGFTFRISRGISPGPP